MAPGVVGHVSVEAKECPANEYIAVPSCGNCEADAICEDICESVAVEDVQLTPDCAQSLGEQLGVEMVHELSGQRDEGVAQLCSQGMAMCRSEPGSISIRPNILRGAKMSKLLRQGTELWLQSPIDLPGSKKQSLYQMSEPSQKLDCFLSHTWLQSGRLKYVALLLRFGAADGIIAGLLAMTAAILLTMRGVLPVLDLHVATWGNQAYEMPLAPWATLFGTLGALVGVAISPWAQLRMCSDRSVFLDAVCIDQVNQQIQAEGIYSLGGFVHSSTEFQILWSPPYFTRLWCVFELAAFKFAHPDGIITFCPLFFHGVGMRWFSALLAVFLLFDLGINSGFLVAYVAALIFGTVLVCMPALRKAMQELRCCRQQLAAFDCERALCRDLADREFILRSIQVWFGSVDVFNRYIREDLSRVVGNIVRTGISYPFCLACSSPFFFFCGDILSCVLMTGLPARFAISCVASYTVQAFTVAPLLMFLVNWLADQAAPCKWLSCNIFINVSFSFVATAFTMFAHLVGMYAAHRGPAWTCAYSIVCISVCVVAFRAPFSR